MTAGNYPEIPSQQPFDDRDRPHKPTDDREEIYFQGTPLMRGELGKLVGFAVAGIVLILLPFIGRAMSDSWWPWWANLLLIFLGLALLLVPWLQTRFIRYRVSNYRIDFERGILSKKIDTLELWHVEDISFDAGPIDRIFGTGTITILSHDDSTPKLELKSLPGARPLFDQLKQRVISVKRQRGVIKMDMGNLDLGQG